MDLLRLRVPDVYCDGWLPAIRLAVRQLPGTGTVSSPDDEVVTVQYDRSAVEVDAIQQALRTVGFESSVLADGWDALLARDSNRKTGWMACDGPKRWLALRAPAQ